ncbi:MAG: hypothetical protein AAF637_28465, partial [Pseudomonadota bacterium]
MRWVISFLVLVAVVVGALWYGEIGPFGSDAEQQATGRPDTEAPAPGLDSSVVVTAAEVMVSSPRERVRSIGTGRALRSVEVTTDVAGIIEQVHFQPNERVEAGAPLLTLERAAEEITLSSAEADFESQRAA